MRQVKLIGGGEKGTVCTNPCISTAARERDRVKGNHGKALQSLNDMQTVFLRPLPLPGIQVLQFPQEFGIFLQQMEALPD